MRKVAAVKNANSDVKRVMIHEYEDGVYVYTFSSLADGFSLGDEWYESVSEAERICRIQYDVDSSEWKVIDDPLEGCQGDWIMPVRMKGRDIGNPQWGQFEKLENGVWKEFVP